MAEWRFYQEGVQAYRAGDFPAAIDCLRGLLDQGDLAGRLARYYTAMSHRGLARDHIRSGDYAQAAQELGQATVLVGNHADLAGYLLAVYARTGQRELFAQQAERMAHQQPADALAQVSLAQAQWQSGRRPLAILTLTQAIRHLGDLAILHVNMGLMQAAQDQHEQARVSFAKAVQADKRNPDAWRYLALTESALGNVMAAAEAMLRAYRRGGENLMLTYELCLVCDAAVKAGHRFVIPLRRKAHGLRGGDIGALARAIAADHDLVAAFLALPPSSVDGEVFGLLSAALRGALREHPDYADLHYQASCVHARLGRSGQAIEHARLSVAINSGYTAALLHLAGLEGKAGRLEAAQERLSQALRAGGDWPDVHAALGDVLGRAGQKEQAELHYRRALELNRNYTEAAEGLSRLAA